MAEITRTPADEPPHDVLAAEEFAMPAPDPALHHGPVTLPDDPSGISEAHDVLAAEEFAMPAAVRETFRSPGGGARAGTGRETSRLTIAALAGLLVLVARRLWQSGRTA